MAAERITNIITNGDDIMAVIWDLDFGFFGVSLTSEASKSF